jgi:hypothetical protein
VIETPAKSLEVREGATPVSTQADTAFPAIPQVDLASGKAAPDPKWESAFL